MIDTGTEFGASVARRLRDGRGGDIVVLSGIAHVDADAPAADANPAWLEKYAAHIEQIGMTPASYAARFSVPVRIRLTRVDGR